MDAPATQADPMLSLAVQVEQMISDRRPFGEIEDRIEEMTVSEDEKAALWLLAWSGKPETIRRQSIIEALDFAAMPG